MTKKKSTGQDRATDRHKPARQVRIRIPIFQQLEALAELNSSTPPEEANRLIREGLEKLGFWPPRTSD